MISELVARQRAYYATGATRSYGFRKEALAKLAGGLETHQEALYQALQADLNKTPCESHLSEVGMVRSELRYHQKHLRKWTKPKRMPSAIGQLPGRCNTVPEPYGVTLIMAPWNYPYLLSLDPLFGAVAAGNCVVLKPSAYAPNTSRAMAELLARKSVGLHDRPEAWQTLARALRALNREEEARVADARALLA